MEGTEKHGEIILERYKRGEGRKGGGEGGRELVYYYYFMLQFLNVSFIHYFSLTILLHLLEKNNKEYIHTHTHTHTPLHTH